MELSVLGANIFGRIARISASVTDAPVALVTLRHNKKLIVLGSSVVHLAAFDESWTNEAVLVKRQTISFVKNVRSDPNFKNHPLFTIAPFMRSLVHVPSQVAPSEFEASITVINPQKKWRLRPPIRWCSMILLRS